MSGISFVTTPIGDDKDITVNALECLRKSNILICEDTRVTKELLKRQNIDYADDYSPTGPHGEFAGTAAWYPTLHTDANGEVTVSFTLPDEPATWRLNARAITVDSQVGEGVNSFEVD